MTLIRRGDSYADCRLWEKLRRLAARRGLRLIRSRSRHIEAHDYGLFALLDRRTGEYVNPMLIDGYPCSWRLDQVADHLMKPRRRRKLLGGYIVRKVERELRKAYPQARIETSGKNHLRLRFPGGNFVTVSNTPRCGYLLDNVRRDIQRRQTPANKRSVQQ